MLHGDAVSWVPRTEREGDSVEHQLPPWKGIPRSGLYSQVSHQIRNALWQPLTCLINFCLLLRVCGNLIPSFINGHRSSVSFHGSYLRHSMLSGMVSQNTRFVKFFQLSLKNVHGYCLHACLYITYMVWCQQRPAKGHCFPMDQRYKWLLNCHVDTMDRTQVLCKIIQWS